MDKKEKYKNARAFIVLLAALITWILNMKCGRSLLQALIVELAVIIIFFIISTVAINIIDKIANMETKVVYDEEPDEEAADAEAEADNDNEQG